MSPQPNPSGCCPGTTTSCCPEDPVPDALTLSDGTNSMTLEHWYDPVLLIDKWIGTGTVLGCEGQTFVLLCRGPNWGLEIISSILGPFDSMAYACSPIQIDFGIITGCDLLDYPLTVVA
ncbi:hypothetical protein GC163_24265 [bacterium]|nr:hypothetical protein [bacterium]